MSKTGAHDSTTSPPGGLGSTPGLGEAFKINLNTGQGVYSYKIVLPGGIADHTPKLAIEYSHGARWEQFGFGWKLSLRAISRRLELGVSGGEPHETYLDGGDEIVPLIDSSFGALKETTFTRYTRSGDGWLIEERDGSSHALGTTAQGRIEDPSGSGRVLQWLIEKSTDASGNEIKYGWSILDGFGYIREILYASYAVRFVYEDRPDVRLDGKTGFLRRLSKRCIRVELYLDPGSNERKIRAWIFSYDNSSINGASLLKQIQMISFGEAEDQSDSVVRAPLKFSYHGYNPHQYSVSFIHAEGPHPPPLTERDVALVTLDSAPLPGILQVANGRQHYWANDGRGGWEQPRRVGDTPFSGSFAQEGVAFVDMNSAGRPDLLVVGRDSPPGYYENEGRDGWGRFVAYPRGQRTAPEWASARLRLTDNDGDGRIDAVKTTNRAFVVWRNLGPQGWADPQLLPKQFVEEAPDADFADPLTLLGDMTGDGLQDIVQVRSGSVQFWPNLGNGKYGAPVRMKNSPRLRDVVRNHGGVFLLDVDGDGCADLIRVGADGITICINRHGAEFAEPVLLETIPTPIPGTIRVANMTGSVDSGLIWNSYVGRSVRYVQLVFSPSQAPYLLAATDNGSGLSSQLWYRSAVEDYLEDKEKGIIWQNNFPFPLLVAAGMRETDAVSGQVTEIQYKYHDAHYEPRTRQFQGFNSAERIEKGDESRADTKIVFHYLMGMERAPGNGIEHAALNGALARTEIYSLDGSSAESLAYRIEESEYRIDLLQDVSDGRRRSFLSVSMHRTEDHERTSSLRGEEKLYTYDAIGNVVREIHRGYGLKDGVKQAERQLTTEITYATSKTRRLLGKPAVVVLRDDEGKIIAETRSFYDGDDFIGLPSGEANRGLLVRESKLACSEQFFADHYAGMNASLLGYHLDVDSDGRPSRFIHTRRHAYDERGLKVAVRDSLGVDTGQVYDETGLLRIKLLDPLGETQFIYDRAVGQPTTVTYPDGSVVHFNYDAQGRVLSTLSPGDDPLNPPRTYHYDDNAVPASRTIRMRASKTGAVSSEALTYFDGRGDEYQQRVEVSAGKYLVSGKRLFNPWGELKKEYQPTFSADREFQMPKTTGQPSRAIFYDGRGRVVRTVNFNEGVSTAIYTPFSVTVSDANDNDHSSDNVARGQSDTPSREEFDVFRQRTRIVELSGTQALMTTTYRTNQRGFITEILDELGALCAYEYDLLGNRCRMTHRAAGERRLWFDARGKVVRSVDANGTELSVQMDVKGRISKLLSGDTAIEEYAYDDLAQNAHGRLARVVYRQGSQAFHFDKAGKLVRHDFTFEGLASAHSIKYEYDYLGRQTAVVHSDGTRIEKNLMLNGWVRAIDGILSDVTYDARGLPSKIVYANGVTTSYSYTDGPGRVKTRKTIAPGGQVYEDATYDYDQMELVLSGDDTAPNGRGQSSYAYDPLYQLRSVSHSAGGAEVTNEYEYFNHLNISRFDEAGSIFHYDDAAHPDRISAISAVGGALSGKVFYDDNGNMLNLGSKTFSYNEKNELLGITDAKGLVAEYGYDHEGYRVSKLVKDAQGLTRQTFFIRLDVEIRDGSAAYFVRLNNLRVAIIHDGKKEFVHSDSDGSTAYFTSATGTKLAAVAYRPFGNLPTTSGNPDFRTFSVHPFDAESGLYYMRRRYYAPETGRFLTPDPLALNQPQKFLSNPKALHPYIYVGNDPLNNIDYDGLSFWSVVGAVVGVAAAIGAAALVVLTGGIAAVVLGVVFVTCISYAIANANKGTGGGEFFRGFMIGLNAGLNMAIATFIFGPQIGIALGVINFLAAFDTIAGNKVYQGILGWSSLLMPMSWLINGFGLLFFLFNIVAAGVSFNQCNESKIHKISINWETGALVMRGGYIKAESAFDMGNFVFLRSKDSTAEAHETGHTLSLAAFGSVFHLVGAIDEGSSGQTGLAERLADSHDPKLGGKQPWDMWSPEQD